MNKYLKPLMLLLILASGNYCPAADTANSDNGSGFWKSLTDFFLPHAENRHVLFQKQTQYFLISVETDHNDQRHMVFYPNHGSQGIWSPDSPDKLISNYCQYTTLFLQGIDQYPRRVLFIGMGAGIMPQFIRRHFPSTIIDIVEIDSEIPGIAEKYFGFQKDERFNLIIADGRDFINRNKFKYDIIFIDAYNAESIPYQLTTTEFYNKVRTSLMPGGLMTVNIANLGKAQFIASELKTMREVFPDSAFFVCPEASNYIVFAALNRKFDSSTPNAKCVRLASTSNPELKFDEMLETRMPEDELQKMTKDATALKDDFAPVETMK